MAAYSQITVIGNLGGDPEVKTAGKSDICTFSVAVNKKRQGKDVTQWYRAVIFNEKLIDVADKYLRKGDPVMIAGDHSPSEWEDRDGKSRTTEEVLVFSLQLLGQASDGAGTARRDDRGGRSDRRDDRGRDDRAGRDDRRGGRNDRSDDRRTARDDRGGGRGRDRDDDDDKGSRGRRDDGKSQIDDDSIPF
jgi:single-strand DNA-binding protein